jgi:hypothetical protein
MVTRRTRSTTSFWGWLRFLPQGTQTEAQLQFRPAGTRAFQTVGAPVPVTSAFGFFTATRAVATPGTWRAVFVEPFSRTTFVSREVPVS